MAIILDSHNKGRLDATSLTVSVTTGAISDAAVAVLVEGRGNGPSFAATFNGSSMTKFVYNHASYVAEGYILALGDIGAGSKNAVITGDGDTGWIGAAVYVLSGVHQTTPAPAGVTQSSEGSSITCTPNPALADCAYFDALSGASAASPSMGAQTNRVQEHNVDTPGTGPGASSRVILGAGTSQVLDWTIGAGEAADMVAFAVQPAAGGGGGFDGASLYRWNGSAWVAPGILKYWNGSSWAAKTMKIWVP